MHIRWGDDDNLFWSNFAESYARPVSRACLENNVLRVVEGGHGWALHQPLSADKPPAGIDLKGAELVEHVTRGQKDDQLTLFFVRQLPRVYVIGIGVHGKTNKKYKVYWWNGKNHVSQRLDLG